MTNPTALERIAYGNATAFYVSNVPEDQWYQAYETLVEAIDESDLTFEILQSFESLMLDEIVDRIDDDAASILKSIKQALELAKDGIIDAAIETDLPSDMNELDMLAMTQRGSENR